MFVYAGTQSGKTSWGPWWLWREIYGAGAGWPGRGAGDYLAVTASYDLFKLKMLPMLRETFEHLLRLGRYWSGDRIIELADPTTGQFSAKRADDPMWGRIILRSAESGGGLESSSALAAWLDECGQDSFTVETFEAVLRRLSLSRGRVLGTTTLYNVGWTKTEIYDRWLAGDPQYRVIQFPSYLNPAFSRAEFEERRSTMQAHRFTMMYEGGFARPVGLIYSGFTDELVIAPFALPAAWPRYVGIDFGGANTALVWIAHDLPRNRYIVYREALSGNKTTQAHAAEAQEHARSENVVRWWGGAKSETQQRLDWTAAGVPVLEPPVADVESGIDRVAQLFATKRLVVFDTLRGIRDQLGSYRRKVDPTGTVTEEIEAKRTYHYLDALRYGVSGIAEGGQPFRTAVAGQRQPVQGSYRVR